MLFSNKCLGIGIREIELFFYGLINLLDPQFNCSNIKKFGGLKKLGLLIFWASGPLEKPVNL